VDASGYLYTIATVGMTLAPIRVAQTRSRMTALQHQQLLAQTKAFRNQECSGPENCRKGQHQKSKHLRPRLPQSQQDRLVNAVRIMFFAPYMPFPDSG
jgi:hypothetical protein